MIDKADLIALLNFLKYHNLCQAYYDKNNGLIHIGYQLKLDVLRIKARDVVYHVEKDDVILLDNSHGLERISIKEPHNLSQYSVHRYQSPMKNLPFPLKSITPFDKSLSGIDYKTDSECNWTLFELMQQLATSSLIHVIEKHTPNGIVTDDLKATLSSSDQVHPCIKANELITEQNEQFKNDVVRHIQRELDTKLYEDSNGNRLGNELCKVAEIVGPMAVTIEPTKPIQTIGTACKIYGRDINLQKLSEWFSYLAKDIQKDVLESEFGVSLVYGALKQAGLYGENTFVTNNKSSIRILKSEFADPSL